MQGTQVQYLVKELDPTCYNQEFNAMTKDSVWHNKDKTSFVSQLRPGADKEVFFKNGFLHKKFTRKSK